MYWFNRPPYLRWASAALLVAVALWMDLRSPPAELRPFAIADIPAGAAIDSTVVEYRKIPLGLLPDPQLRGYAATRIAAGEPLTAGATTDRPPLPEGWWAIEMDAPAGVSTGAELRLIDGQSATAIPALVLHLEQQDEPAGWSQHQALVAVPAEHAAIVAAATTHGTLTILVARW